ncbi:MAG: N-acetylmuramoyl-L-alanine amidase [Crocinitomicaceae bacterium]|nr:N-acetylmuramoyl-L-alanine amidase [Crocinitomicaceae bacterium]MDG2463687.1 N-acetylmuramoyl-L-alanine amidase [Crocinitomicaceae bacterium]
MRFIASILILIVGSLFYGMSPPKNITVVIDAGHGGKDPGHLSHSSNHKTEKEINLKIANLVGEYVEKYLYNVKVVYTRTDDSFLSLDERVDLANGKNANFFISVHCNGSPQTGVYGTESHVHDFSAKKSYNFAKDIESQFSKRAGRNSRGVKNNEDRAHSIQVLKFTEMTSVLVECGFLTNTSEANYLNSTHGQEILASAIFRAFRDAAQRDYPDVNVTNKPRDTEETKEYTIQLMSSKRWIDTDSPDFKRLNMKVTRVELNTTNAYKYIYYAGTFTTLSEAKTVLEKVKNKGYRDALIVPKKD